LPEFNASDLVNLGKYNIYLKLMIDGLAGKPFSATTLPPLPEMEKSHKEKIIQVSREKYSNPRKVVEEKIAKWTTEGAAQGAETIPSPSQTPQVTMYDARCSLCGKDTKVVFQPDGVRPVYCKPCRKKLEEEKSSSTPSPTPSPTPTPTSTSTPAPAPSSEATADKTTDKPAPTPTTNPAPIPSSPTPVEKVKEKSEDKPKNNGVSLKQAVEKQPVFFSTPKKNKTEREKPKRKEVDVNELKQELENALKDEEPSPTDKVDDKNKKEGVIEPGETIKL
jgi:CxxC-x17-CxxC domain-containing protein